jgi:hypothetical protein
MKNAFGLLLLTLAACGDGSPSTQLASSDVSSQPLLARCVYNLSTGNFTNECADTDVCALDSSVHMPHPFVPGLCRASNHHLCGGMRPPAAPVLRCPQGYECVTPVQLALAQDAPGECAAEL